MLASRLCNKKIIRTLSKNITRIPIVQRTVFAFSSESKEGSGQNLRITADNMNQLSLNVNKNKKESQWIFSTKYEQMLTGKQGKVTIYPEIPSDTHNISLRLINYVKQSKFVITTNPERCHGMLKALTGNIRFVQDCLQKKQQSDNDTVPIVSSSDRTLMLADLTVNHHQIKDVQYNSEIQISKFIELQKESKYDPETYRQKFKHHKITELKSYMQFKSISEQIAEISNKQGYPAIFQYESEKLDEYLHLQGSGMNLIFIIDEKQIEKCGECIKKLQQKKLPYQIMPTSDELIRAIVSSALPADRFSLDYYPNDIQALLSRRKNMKLTLAIKITYRRLSYLLQKIGDIYSKNHIVYIKYKKDVSPVYTEFKGQVSVVEQQLDKQQIIKPDLDISVIVAPYLADFNQSLKSQINKKSHIIGQLQSEKINMVEMQILSKKLEEMNKRQMKHQLNVYLLTAELVGRLKNLEQVQKVLRKILPKKISSSDIQKMVKMADDETIPDYLEIDKIQ